MKIVIADASCLMLFTNIGRLDVLEKLFEHVWVTESVKKEYGLDLPEFISVHDPQDKGRLQALSLILDAGEAASIALAVEHPDSRIIIDEKKGRRIAFALGLDVVGTLGVLIEAAQNGLIRPDDDLVKSLDQQGFRLSNRLKERLKRG